MTEKDIEDMIALDEAAERCGGFTAPNSDRDTHFDYRGIIRYCKEKGIEPIDMTIRELNKFIIAG